MCLSRIREISGLNLAILLVIAALGINIILQLVLGLSGPDIEVQYAEEQECRNRLDLNTASVSELCSLPGIGPVRADRIVQYRRTTGGFKSPRDICNVKGLGPKTFKEISDLIEVSP